MNKKSGILLVVAGAVLLGAALLFALYNEYVDAKAGEASEDLLAQLRAAIEERTETTSSVTVPDITVNDTDTDADTSADTDGNEVSQPVDTEKPADTPKILTVNGYDCIGYLEIPALGLTLPVLNDWDYARLKVAPCRQFGGIETDDLVIAGHNYFRHFAYLHKLRRGDGITIYDIDGVRHDYTVTKVATVNAKDVDAAQNSGSALVLYTCTYIEMTRTAVFCEKNS